jgi:UDP-N-acetylmuramate--alanine ligase
MNLQTLKNIYFIGIGGIGMSALARWFKSNGYQIAGYDLTSSYLTQQLEKEDIAIHYQDDIKLIPEKFLQEKEHTLIVFTPAVPKNHSELVFFQENGFEVKKRSQVLGFLTENLFTVAVAGTHGKTTTSSMVAHILTTAQKNVTAFLGGITQNYGSNMLMGKGGLEDAIVVAEADEYDRSFLTLYPDIAIITSADADHLDIYGSHDEVKKSFEDFIKQIKPGGILIIRQNLALSNQNSTIKLLSYSNGLGGDVKAENVRTANGQFVFDILSENQNISDIILGVPGFHNVENATAAAGVALQLGIAPDLIKSALSSFRGVKRRFDYIVKNEKHIYIDDYAHHPAEIEAFLTSVKALYPDKKVTAIFQPHLFTRTRDFAHEFAKSLSLADELILLEIYPARELPIEGVTSEIIFKDVTTPTKKLIEKKDLLNTLQSSQIEVLATIGAGDIDRFIEPISQLLIQ